LIPEADWQLRFAEKKRFTFIREAKFSGPSKRFALFALDSQFKVPLGY